MFLRATFTGFRGPNGRIISRKQVRQTGAIVFGGGLDEQTAIDEALSRGHSIFLSEDGTYAGICNIVSSPTKNQ